jgi:hypothetical protein
VLSATPWEVRCRAELWDALRSCAYTGELCQYALGDTPETRYIGTWSDGTPIIGLKIPAQTPIRAVPVPDRAPAPPAADGKPSAKLTKVLRKAGRVTRPRGTATDDHGIDTVEIAVLRKTHGRCRSLNANSLFVTSSRTEPTAFLTATGKRTWRLVLPRKLTRGSYTVIIRETDTARQRTLQAPADRSRPVTIA